MAQPIFQPVQLKVLPALLTVTVRSSSPGTAQTRAWRADPRTMCSYTSSERTSASNRWHSAEIWLSSSRVNILPVGLWGVLTMTSRVALENEAESSSGSNHHDG